MTETGIQETIEQFEIVLTVDNLFELSPRISSLDGCGWADVTTASVQGGFHLSHRS